MLGYKVLELFPNSLLHSLFKELSQVTVTHQLLSSKVTKNKLSIKAFFFFPKKVKCFYFFTILLKLPLAILKQKATSTGT